MSVMGKHRSRYLPSYRVLQGQKYQQALLPQSKLQHSIYLGSILALNNLWVSLYLPSSLHTPEYNDSVDIINRQATQDGHLAHNSMLRLNATTIVPIVHKESDAT